jgi:hypothetical protein
MDKFNVIWCTLWSDYFMTQHQFDNGNHSFNAPVSVASDFLFFLSELLGYKKEAHYANSEKTFVTIKLTDDEIEKITDWIVDFNFSTRKPFGLMMPDLYLDEEKIAGDTVNIYCHRIAEFIAHIINNQNTGRDKIADWALGNFMAIYAKAYSEALQEKINRKRSAA